MLNQEVGTADLTYSVFFESGDAIVLRKMEKIKILSLITLFGRGGACKPSPKGSLEGGLRTTLPTLRHRPETSGPERQFL